MPRAKTPSKRAKSPRKKRSKMRQAETEFYGGPRPLVEVSMDYINLNFTELIKRYPGEFVVALGNRIIAHGADMDEATERASSKAGDKAMSAVISFVPECVADAAIV